MAAFNIRYVTSGAGGGNGTSVAQAWNLTEAVANYAKGQEIRVLNDGTYILSGNTSLATSGTAEDHVLWIGRKADNSAYESAYINCVTYYFRTNANYIKVFYLDFYGTPTGYVFGATGAASVICRCKIKNGNTTTTTGAANAIYTAITTVNFVECYGESSLPSNISSSTTQGVLATVSRASIINCKFVTKNVGIVATGASAGNVIHGNLIVGSGGVRSLGILWTTQVSASNVSSVSYNTIYNFNYGIYFNNLEPITIVAPFSITNNLFHTIVDPNPSSDPLQNGYCIYTPESVNKPNNLVKLNKYYNCDNFSNSKISACFHEIENAELTSDPFVLTDPNPSFDATTPDYSLNNVAGGGLSCKEQDAYPAFNYYWNH